MVTIDQSGCFEQDYTLKTEVGFPIYGITIMTFLGWFWLCFYMPTGMWAYVFDYIGAWTRRPKPMNEADFDREKAELAKKVQGIIAKGRKLVKER